MSQVPQADTQFNWIGAGPKTSGYDDPSSKLWSIYVAEVAQYDKALVENWKKDMDAILIFVCTKFVLPIPHGLRAGMFSLVYSLPASQHSLSRATRSYLRTLGKLASLSCFKSLSSSRPPQMGLMLLQHHLPSHSSQAYLPSA